MNRGASHIEPVDRARGQAETCHLTIANDVTRVERALLLVQKRDWRFSQALLEHLIIAVINRASVNGEAHVADTIRYRLGIRARGCGREIGSDSDRGLLGNEDFRACERDFHLELSQQGIGQEAFP